MNLVGQDHRAPLGRNGLASGRNCH